MHGPQGLETQVMTSELIVEAQLEHSINYNYGERHIVPGVPESQLNRPKSSFVVLNVLKQSKGSTLKPGDRSTFALSDSDLTFAKSVYRNYSEGVYLLFLEWHEVAKSWVPAQRCTTVRRDPDGNATGFNMLVRKKGDTVKKFYTWEEARALVLEEVASQTRLRNSRLRKPTQK